MGAFLEAEKTAQQRFKVISSSFSEAARASGVFMERPRPFCVPIERSPENLFPEIRRSAMSFFHDHHIKWHDELDGNPSNHMCDSQICCVNFLFPFADKPEALAALLQPFFPSLSRVLEIEDQYITFEWIGLENYLKERIPRNGQRTRGAHFTSADAAVLFEHDDGRHQIVLIEWKYTESYDGTHLLFSAKGTDRRAIYRWLYEDPCCPLDQSLIPSFDDLFYEPFYQLMRQQFLAWRMELARELGADIVSVLHVAPLANGDFRAVTSPALRSLGVSPTVIWPRLLRQPDRFFSVATEDLFRRLPVNRFPELSRWWSYVSERYRWLCRNSFDLLGNTDGERRSSHFDRGRIENEDQ